MINKLNFTIKKRNIAVITLYNKEKKILLQHRSETAKILPNHWAFFGGGIEAGETPEQAVRREGKALGWKTFAETKNLKIGNHDREVLKKIKNTL